MKSVLFRKGLVLGATVILISIGFMPIVSSSILRPEKLLKLNKQVNVDVVNNDFLNVDNIKLPLNTINEQKEHRLSLLRHYSQGSSKTSLYRFRERMLQVDDGNYTPHDPIYIWGDENFTEENGVVGGNGTPDNPYLIEGWEISSTEYLYGIMIRDTRSYFIIRSCLLKAEDGVHLFNVTFGTISTSICDGHAVGVYVYLSSNVTIRDSTLYGGKGLGLRDSLNVSAINCSISTSSEWGEGIGLRNSPFTILSNLTVSDSFVGVFISQSPHTVIRGCNVFSNGHGVRIIRSPYQVLRDNSFHDNTYNFGFEGATSDDYYHDIDTSNMINGKPVCLIYNESNLVFNEGENIGFLGLIGCDHITIENLEMHNNVNGLLLVETVNSTVSSSTFSNNLDGLTLFDSSYNTIVNCTTVGGHALYGIVFQGDSAGNYILDCNFSGGIFLWDSPNNVLRNNTISGEYLNFWVDGQRVSDYYQDIDKSNKINGKPIYYFIGEEKLTIRGSNIGYLGFVDCNNVKIRDINIKYNGEGILLVNTTADIRRCTLWSNYWGIHLFSCIDVEIYHCSIKYNTDGFRLDHSSANKIFMCDVSANWWSGFQIHFSNGNTIRRCKVVNSGVDGFQIFDSLENEIHYNNIYGNGWNAMTAYDSTVDATYNWWGREDGPSGDGPGNGDSVYAFNNATISYEPWLEDPAVLFIRFLDIFLLFLQRLFELFHCLIGY